MTGPGATPFVGPGGPAGVVAGADQGTAPLRVRADLTDG